MPQKCFIKISKTFGSLNAARFVPATTVCLPRTTGTRAGNIVIHCWANRPADHVALPQYRLCEIYDTHYRWRITAYT